MCIRDSRKIVGWVRFDLDVHDRAGREPAPDAVVAGEQLRQRLQRALAGLPPRQREALVLRRYHDLSQRDIAAAMGTSEGAVESLLVRALETLRRELVPEPGAG